MNRTTEFKYCKLTVLALVFCVAIARPVCGEAETTEVNNNTRILSIEEFIVLATGNDTVFEEILVAQLKLNYQKDLALPAGDFIASLKGQYDLFLDQDRSGQEYTVALSKLFPFTGTDLSITYRHTPSYTADAVNSDLQFLVSQPIAQNAFGGLTRLLERIVGLEVDVLRFQVVEAYEDYLASLIKAYYAWYSAYENLEIAKVSDQLNMKMLENIHERRRQKIALPIDVNKVELLVLRKKEDLIALREKYSNLSNTIEKSVRYEDSRQLVPEEPSHFKSVGIDFEREYKRFKKESRTYSVLRLLEKRSSLDVEKAAGDLLPSTNLLVGFEMDGDDWNLANSDSMFYAGISLDWPLPGQVQKAKHELSKVKRRETALSNENKYREQYTNLKNLHLSIERERELLKTADEKIRLSEAILSDEEENYSFGKVTLNDYIDAVNRLDQNKISRISHLVQFKILMIEWQRLTDKLVGEEVLNELK